MFVLKRSCIFGDKDYSAVLKKVERSNPNLIAELNKLEKNRRMDKIFEKVLFFLSYGLAIGGLCLLAYDWFVKYGYGILTFIGLAMTVIGMVIPYIYHDYLIDSTREKTREEIKMYEQLKIEFSKVGCELP